MKTYTVKIVALAGPSPFDGSPLPGFTEEITVTANSDREAALLGPAKMKHRPLGQIVETYLDGERYLLEF